MIYDGVAIADFLNFKNTPRGESRKLIKALALDLDEVLFGVGYRYVQGTDDGSTSFPCSLT